MPRIVVGISGASGMALARDILAFLQRVPGMELHLVVSAGARRVMHTEGLSLADVTLYAAQVYAPTDMTAPPASGSWQHDSVQSYYGSSDHLCEG